MNLKVVSEVFTDKTRLRLLTNIYTQESDEKRPLLDSASNNQ